MKIKPYFALVFLLFCIVFPSNNIFAQEDKKTKGLFVDWDLSVMIADGDFLGHAALASGYRFNEKMAAGLEWRGASKFSCCNNFGMNGVGVTYRYTEKWFLAKLTTGKVLKASRGEDFGSDWQFQKGGFYYSASIAYRTRPGFLFGINYTGVRGNKFDYYLQNIDNLEFTFDRVETVNFGTIGIMVGAAFPGRGRDPIKGIKEL